MSDPLFKVDLMWAIRWLYLVRIWNSGRRRGDWVCDWVGLSAWFKMRWKNRGQKNFWNKRLYTLNQWDRREMWWEEHQIVLFLFFCFLLSLSVSLFKILSEKLTWDSMARICYCLNLSKSGISPRLSHHLQIRHNNDLFRMALWVLHHTSSG